MLRSRNIVTTSVVLALLALLTEPARAEDNCGRMVVSAVRLRGTVRAVEPLGRRELVVTPVGDVDPRFVIAVAVDTVEPATAAVARGRILNLAVHSPARLLGPRAVVGSVVDLELEAMHCDGVFRRFVRLRERPSRLRSGVEEFKRGPLEAEAALSEAHLRCHPHFARRAADVPRAFDAEDGRCDSKL